MRRLNLKSHPDLLVGAETGDDALVWRRPSGQALVATVDFFTPVVDDARTWGRIAAANAVSDIYAMGGSPLFALNLVAWPRDQLPLDLLSEVLLGGEETAEEGGWVVAGGHTVDGPEPMYGQAVVGEVDPASMLTNAGGQAGDALVLTKAIGTGLVATAVKRCEPSEVASGGKLAEAYEAALAGMTRLNAEAAATARASGATAGTDVTGFGLLGHLHKLAAASNLAAVIDVEAVPVLPGAWELLEAGFVPGGTDRNREFFEPWVEKTDDERVLTMLCDAQTSGGLLFACRPEAAAAAVAELCGTGHAAAVVGQLLEGAPGSIRLANAR
jgi:selenide,water dikinase